MCAGAKGILVLSLAFFVSLAGCGGGGGRWDSAPSSPSGLQPRAFFHVRNPATGRHKLSPHCFRHR